MPGFYDDAADSEGSSPAPAKAPAACDKTCLLPKSAFPDAKPGSTITVEVVRVHDDEIEVCPQGQQSEDETTDDEEGSEQPPDSGSPMRSMLED